MIRGEIPIELEDSWFIAKDMLVSIYIYSISSLVQELYSYLIKRYLTIIDIRNEPKGLIPREKQLYLLIKIPKYSLSEHKTKSLRYFIM